MGRGSKGNELVIARVRVKSPRRMQDGGWEWVTIIETVSATGMRIPGYYIYAGEAHYDGWHHGSVDPEVGFYHTHNGWTDDRCGFNWLKNHFARFCPPSKPGVTRLLLCDNHSSHDNYEFMEYCLNNNIALFFLPAHTTHILQPLDVGIPPPINRFCTQEVSDWRAAQPLHEALHKGDFISMCERARKKGLTKQNIMAAFNKCGIWPLNRQRVLSNPEVRWSKKSPILKHNLQGRPSHQTEIQRLVANEPTNLKRPRSSWLL